MMRLTEKLLHVAAIVAAASGCGGAVAATASQDDGGTTEGGNPGDGGSRDATTGDVGSGGQDASAMDGEAGGWEDGGGDACVPISCAALGYTCGVAADGCGGTLNCGSCTSPEYCGGGGINKCGGLAPDGGCWGPCGCPSDAALPSVSVSAAQACQMLEEARAITTVVSVGVTCSQVCGYPGGCELPQSYVSEVEALNPDGGVVGVPSDGGPPTYTLDCPTSPSPVWVTCPPCIGRLTEGYCAPDGMRPEVPPEAGRGPERSARREGERLAAMAYLEAVSVHAFERLERELEVHRAPPALLRGARRARRDEVRHTAMTARLARERGGSPRLPEAPAPARARTLLEVALENAVEGCVRETYGAVQGLVEAQTSRDRGIRRAMKSLAADECRHAELGWAVHAWAMPRLNANERLQVERAMKDAIAEIAARDPRTASLLFACTSSGDDRPAESLAQAAISPRAA